MRPRIAAVLLLALSACPKEVPPSSIALEATAKAPAAPPAPGVLVPLTENERLERRIASLASEALALEKAQDEALWAHWTAGVPLELERASVKHAVLFDEATPVDVEAARSRKIGDPLGVRRLQEWIAGARLARTTATATGALTELEARLTFKLGDKEVRWRDLGRLLANEKSAVKRRALWAAAREVLKPLAEGYRARDAEVAEWVAPDAASVATATALLDDTEAEWKLLLEQLAKSELGLPVDKLGREDLPRLLRPSAVADAAFPRHEQAAKATALLNALGLYGLPGLTLDLTDASKKNPVPLTVAVGGPADVRVCFRPAGGVRDLGALFAELGRALAIREVTDRPETLPGLAIFPEAEAAAQLFGQIVDAPSVLREFGVTEPDAAAVAKSQRALRLFGARKAAGNAIAASLARGQGDDLAAELWRTWSTRALGVPVAPEDGLRWRLEGDPFGRAASQVHAFALASQWRKLLPEDAWKQRETAALLRTAWGVAHSSGGGGSPTRGDGRLDSTSPDAGSSDAGRDAGRITDATDATDAGRVPDAG